MLGDDGIDNSERHIAVHSVITIFVEQWLGRRREPDFYAHVAPLVVLLAVVVFGCLDRHLKAICADCFGAVLYAALNDASYNGEGTLLFDAATDTPSAA